MNKKIIQIGDQKLFQISEEVEKSEIKSESIQNLIKDLHDTLNAHEGTAAGLSAVQIGALKRVFVIKEKDKSGEILTLINPEITKQSSDTTIEWEGCMSINNGNKRLFGPVPRSKSVTMKYLDINGIQREITGVKFMAHLLLHELDHLDGKLFLQYVTNPENIWDEEELDEYLENNERFPDII